MKDDAFTQTIPLKVSRELQYESSEQENAKTLSHQQHK